jgi:dihydrolipoamide dehydrogenase
MEFASVFNRFGSEVTVIEYLKECLPALDSDIAKRLRKTMEKRGVIFKMKTAVEDIADIDADVILMATGRRPRTPGYTNVDENFRVIGVPDDSPSGIYAIGDVNGRQMLAHAAEMQAIRAVNHILGKSDGIRFDIMPAAIFTDPEAACVGPTEDALKSTNTPVESAAGYTCHKAFWRANGKALAMNETDGMLKLFSDTVDGRILGCHAYGAHSADIVQEVSALMCRDTTIDQLRDMVHIHPTLSEILLSAVQ